MPTITLALAALLAFATPAVAADAVADVPAAFSVQGRQPLLTLQAVGAQIYECETKADGSLGWTFREPIAALMQEGRTVGRHYAGPTWDVGQGGVTGKVVTSAPGATPDDVALLDLAVADRHGTGPLADAQVVLRLHTSGGALAGTCHAKGDLRSVPYRADYVFLK